MIVVGLTGSMGCGKSTVARMLTARGAHLLDSDQLARRALEPGSPALARLAEALGADILAADGSLDRARLGRRVHGDPELWRLLESIVHPQVRRLQAEALAALAETWPRSVVLLDEPLLFETGGDRLCDLTVVVICGDAQISRIEARGGMPAAVRDAAIARQMPEAEKIRRADSVIDNGGDLQATEIEAERFWARIGCQAARGSGMAWPDQWAPYTDSG